MIYRIDTGNFMRNGITYEIEPLIAAVAMTPAFPVISPGILTHKEVAAPFFVSYCVGIFWPADVRFTTPGKLALITQTA
jgi:hypothetical protein